MQTRARVRTLLLTDTWPMPASTHTGLKAAPTVGAAAAGCPWWVVVGAAMLTIYLHPEQFVAWLDIIERLRRKQRET